MTSDYTVRLALIIPVELTDEMPKIGAAMDPPGDGTFPMPMYTNGVLTHRGANAHLRPNFADAAQALAAGLIDPPETVDAQLWATHRASIVIVRGVDKVDVPRALMDQAMAIAGVTHGEAGI